MSRYFFRPYLTIWVVGVALLAIPVFQRTQDWQAVYMPAAERLVNGEDIFDVGYVYPPINALLAVPFLELERVPGLLLWHAINMIALAILVFGAWKLAGGQMLDGMPGVSWREHVAFWLGLLCGLSSCFDAITNQQTDIIVAAIVILGCVALSRKRAWSAAMCFGLAAAIKCTPLLWAPYLAWRRRWGAALLVVVAAVGFNFLPDLIYPKEDSSSLAVEWTQRFLMPMSERESDFGTWACGVGGNQSVPGICQRWLIHETYWVGGNLMGKFREDRATPETLKAVSWSAMLLLLVGGAVSAWRASAGSDVPVDQPATPALHFGIVLVLMVLLSPHSSKPHFCTLILPGFCLARAALNGGHRRLLLLLIVAITCALASNADLAGHWFYSWAKWYGSLAGAALLLMAGSGYLLWTRSSTAPASVLLPFPLPIIARQAA